MQTVTTNNGVELHVKGSIIYTTDAKAFWRSGNMLVGNGTVISYGRRLVQWQKNRSSASITILQKYMPFIFLGGRLFVL